MCRNLSRDTGFVLFIDLYMSSHRAIFKSTAIVGGAQLATIVIGIARTKVMALLLGPVGIGLSGTYLTVTGFIGGITGLGLGASGVRQIAEASASGDDGKLARTVIALRRMSLLSGAVGMVLAIALCIPLSRLTFGDSSRSVDLALMSLSLLVGGVSAGQIALLQGLRRLADMGRAEVAGALLGGVAGVLLVYFFRERGIALFLVANALWGAVFSFWYARKVPVQALHLTWRETFIEARGLMTLGLAFVIQNLLLGSGAYLSRMVIIKELGLHAVGLYTATWTLSSYYVGIVLRAMGTDFYPRLTASAKYHPAMIRLVNEQIEMGLLIAVPGVLAVITLAPFALHLFYSGDFETGAQIIRWQALGVFVQVFSWPIGLVQLGKGRGKLMVISEALSAVVGLVFLLVGLRIWKLDGIGIAFFAATAVMGIFALAIGIHLIGFRWTGPCLQVLSLSCLAVLTVFLMVQFLPPIWSVCGGMILVVGAAIASIISLQKLLRIDLWDTAMRKLAMSKAT